MRGKAGLKGQNQPLKDEGNAQESIMEVNFDQDLTNKMTEDQIAVGNSRHGRKKDAKEITEVDKLDNIEADDASKKGRKKDIAKTADVVEQLNDLEAGNSEKTAPVSKRGKKKGVAKISEEKVGKDLETDNAEKAVPAKRGRRANKNLDVKNIDKTNISNEEVSSVLKANGAALKKENMSKESAGDNVESKCLASEKQKDANSPDSTNVVVHAFKKRGRKKAETKLQSEETNDSASNKETSVEQNEEKIHSDEINEDLVLSNEVSEEKDVGKRSQRKKLIKDEKLEDKMLSKNDNKNVLKQSEGKNVEESKVIESIIDVEENSAATTAQVEQPLKRGRKRKNKLEVIAANVSEDTEKKQITKRQKFPKQSSTALQDSAVITKEVRIVLERQILEKNEQLSTDVELSTYSEKSVPRERGRAPKNKKGKQDEGKSDDDFQPTKSAKVPKKADNSKSSSKKEIPDVTALDFSSESKSSNGKSWNFKISSWNISGIRAWLEKNGLSYFHHEKPDILCVQETKCSDDKLPESVRKVDGYHCYWLSGDKDGYSGVGLLTKEEPKSVNYGIDVPEHDNEGRVITAEYDQFYLVATYVPNAGRGLVRLDYRMKWDKDFRAYLKKLDEKKPVILCGDLNVAHEEIDLANPKTNKKNAGFSKEEREGFSFLLEEGFIDTFRHLYPDVKDAYTFWTYMMNARAKNVGWRLDYFVISKRLGENLCDSVMRKDVFGSDHCPITLFLSL